MTKNEQTGKKAATAFDVEAHEENQRKFLAALRQIAEERGPVDRLTFQYGDKGVGSRFRIQSPWSLEKTRN